MDYDAHIIGTFAPILECAGFEVPVFRRFDRNIPLIQELDERGKVLGLVEHDFGELSYDVLPQVTTTVGRLGVYAFRDLDGGLHIGTQARLGTELMPIISAGRFDDHPLLRFRLSAFFDLTDRVAKDAQAAWGWLEASSSHWAADAWKQEATIVPEVRRCIALHLRDAGASEDDIRRVASGVRAEGLGDGYEITIHIPQEMPWAEQCRSLLARSDNLLGNAVVWWPELSCARIIITPQLTTFIPLREPEKMESLLKEAKTFLDEKVFHPKMKNPRIPKRTKDISASTRVWISECRKIGDVVFYVNRFHQKNGGRFKFNVANEQIMMEDIYDEFKGKFGAYADYRWSIADFEPGKMYGGHLIAIFSEIYSNRHGGIYPVGRIGQHKAVVIKAATYRNKYQNEWIEFGVRIKYYLKSNPYQEPVQSNEKSDKLFVNPHSVPMKKLFDENIPVNRSIIDCIDVPVLVFVKESKNETLYTYHGIFRNAGVKTDPDGAKWFDLVKVDVPP